MDMSLNKLWELAMDGEACVLQSLGLQRVGHNWVTELSWTELISYRKFWHLFLLASHFHGETDADQGKMECFSSSLLSFPSKLLVLSSKIPSSKNYATS